MCTLMGAGYSLLCTAMVTCFISFVAPFWLYETNYNSWFPDWDDLIEGKISSGRSDGLLASCGQNLNCHWVWEDNFKLEKNLKEWQHWSQGLFAGGLLLLVICWFVAMLRVCCQCCLDSSCLGPLLGFKAFIASGLIMSSIGLYVVKSREEAGAHVYDSSIIYFWALYMGAVGSLAALIAAILFFCDCCCSRSRAGYHMTRVV